MLNRSASLAMSTCILKTLPGKLDIKRHSPSIIYISVMVFMQNNTFFDKFNVEILTILKIFIQI